MGLFFQVDDQGYPRPKLCCDACGGTIENAAEGVVLWDRDSETPGSVLEAHFHCSGCAAQTGGAPVHGMPIDVFMLYLANNIQLTPGMLEAAGRSLTKVSAEGSDRVAVR